MLDRYPRLFSVLLTLLFFGLILMYVKEFPFFSNTIEVKWLLTGALIAGLLIAVLIVALSFKKLAPLGRHIPELLFIGSVSLIFSPLFASLLNRYPGTDELQSFEFVSETPFIASRYGILKDEKLKPTGYRLKVRYKGRELSFRYKTQAYFPVTRPGEEILVPVRKGILGFYVVMLK
ncbi:MAG: hypothetical protein RLZ62_2394 [Bacteroidota bacterium]|jgi:hypothetical protein